MGNREAELGGGKDLERVGEDNIPSLEMYRKQWLKEGNDGHPIRKWLRGYAGSTVRRDTKMEREKGEKFRT